MNTPTVITTLAVLLSATRFTLGLPQTSNAVSADPVVFYPWSEHADCAAPATACKQDCGKAVDKICRRELGLDGEVDRNYLLETVGECTVTYVYEIGNTVADYTKCYNTFAFINDKGKFTADGCGGALGGVLGYDEVGNRTNDPIYAIQPKSGNPNCFMPPSKSAQKPLAVNELPDGTKLPLGETCPTELSRRSELRRRVKASCVSGDVGIGVGITATCAAVGFGLGGPIGAAAFPIFCIGADYFAIKGFHDFCEKPGKRDKIFPRSLLEAGPMSLNARAGPIQPASDDPCAMTNKLAVCPNTRMGLLKFHKCPGAEGSESEGETVQAPAGDSTGGSGINF